MKSFSEKVDTIKNAGYKENCPTRYYWEFFKYPFIIRISPTFCDSHRIDRLYNMYHKTIGIK